MLQGSEDAEFCVWDDCEFSREWEAMLGHTQIWHSTLQSTPRAPLQWLRFYHDCTAFVNLR